LQSVPFSYVLDVKVVHLDQPRSGDKKLQLRWSRGDKRVESEARLVDGGWIFPVALSMKATMYRNKAGDYQEKSTSLELVEKDQPGSTAGPERILASCSIELTQWGALEPGSTHPMPALFGGHSGVRLEACLAVADHSQFDPDCLVSRARPSVDLDRNLPASQGSSPTSSPRVSVYSSRDRDEFPALFDEAISSGILSASPSAAETIQPPPPPGAAAEPPARVTISATLDHEEDEQEAEVEGPSSSISISGKASLRISEEGPEEVKRELARVRRELVQAPPPPSPLP